jgi:hypothetical protein
MKFKSIGATLALLPALAFAQASPVLLGTWKGVGNSTVSGSGTYHPAGLGKENPVRYRHVEYVLVIDREEGRNFSGYFSATNNKDSTDTSYKPVILGSLAKDVKSGVYVSEFGTAIFKLVDPKHLELCYAQVTAEQRVASCLELAKQ